MDSRQGSLVINPNSHEWYTLDKIERTPPNPLTFYEDWDSVKLDDRMSRSSQKTLWPTSSKDKDTPTGRVGLNCTSMALLTVVSLLALASLALSVLMLLGMVGPIQGSCACSKQGRRSFYPRSDI